MKVNNQQIRTLLNELRVLCQEQEREITNVQRTLRDLKSTVSDFEKHSIKTKQS